MAIKFAEIEREKVLISWLQGFTQRDLTKKPPKDVEQLTENIGVGPSNLDRFIRVWVNKHFRAPGQQTPIGRGKLPGSTKYSQLKMLSGIAP